MDKEAVGRMGRELATSQGLEEEAARGENNTMTEVKREPLDGSRPAWRLSFNGPHTINAMRGEPPLIVEIVADDWDGVKEAWESLLLHNGISADVKNQ